MKKNAAALALAGAGFIVAAGLCGWLLETYLPGLTAGYLFLNIGIVAKLLLMIVQLMMLPIVGLGIVAIVTGRGQFGVPLAILAGASATLGLLAAAWVLLTVEQTLAAVGPVSFAVVAPQYAEAAFSAAMGLFGATLALGARLAGDRRR